MMTEGGQPLDASNKCNTGRGYGYGYVNGMGVGFSDYSGKGYGDDRGLGCASILRYHNICESKRI